jgi:protein-S-isoprenylcysteine O-methyltransferase Ste14
MGLLTGMQSGLGSLRGIPAICANVALLIQFPALHSFLLSGRGKKFLLALAPAKYARDLATTTYATVASIQLLAVFVLWSPSHKIWWTASGPLRIVLLCFYTAAWLTLAWTMRDAGLGTQLGYLGWWSVWRGRAPEYGDFPKRGTFRYSRQPVYVAFSLVLWSGPTLTPEKILVATLWTVYCLVGPLNREGRCRRRFGAAYDQYRKSVPYWLPIRISLPWRRPTSETEIVKHAHVP